MINENQSIPLVSIIMPVYNRQAYIKRAIDSVLNQSYVNWELITIDDGSQDYSPYLLEIYRAYSHKIKVVYQNHQHLPAARNNGIKNSVGEFITFLDSDDEIAKDHIEQRINYFAQNSEIDLVHGGVKIIGDPFVPDKDDHTKLIHLSDCTIGATFFGKRSVFLDSGGFKDIPYSEDSEFLERIVKKYRVSKVDFPTYVYHRETPDSITNSIK
ncbi:MAG TPA: glycosyltransferase family A protein [Ignavibacteriaceae bacterium]